MCYENLAGLRAFNFLCDLNTYREKRVSTGGFAEGGVTLLNNIYQVTELQHPKVQLSVSSHCADEA